VDVGCVDDCAVVRVRVTLVFYVIQLHIGHRPLLNLPLHCEDVAKNGGESFKESSTRAKSWSPTIAYTNLSEVQRGGGCLGEDARGGGQVIHYSSLLLRSLISPLPVFKVPTTHDVLTALFHPSYPKSHFDLLNLALLGLQVLLFFYLPRRVSKPFFFCYFAFWRAAYDAGLGWVLTKQSKRKWIVREVQRRGWLDQEKRPLVRKWVKKQLVGKMGKDYTFNVRLPIQIACQDRF